MGDEVGVVVYIYKFEAKRGFADLKDYKGRFRTPKREKKNEIIKLGEEKWDWKVQWF